MKLYFILPVTFFINFFVQAQIPQKFNYQAVVRSNTGNIIASQNVRIRFSIRDGAAAGTIQYSETHATVTNTYGLINLQVGAGTIVSGSFLAITWNTGSKFLQVEADVTGGTSYTSLATVELIAVPYAVQAAVAGNFSGSLTGDVSGSQTATVIGNSTITAVKIADDAVTAAKVADNAVTNSKLADVAVTATKIADNAVTAAKIAANAITSAKLADNAVTTTKIVNNAITAAKINTGQVVKSFNGLTDDIVLASTGGATLSVTGNTITIGGNTGDITGITAGAGLTGGGTTGNLALSASFGGDGTATFVSRSDHTHIGQTWTANTGDALNLIGNSANSKTLDIYSYATSFNGAGISSQVLNNTGQSVGVFGNTLSTDGNAAGIFGQAYGNGAAKGVWGLANGANTFGIFGQAVGVNSWAGYFQGRVHVNGTLSKAAGSFRIDHPLDPANKTLSHSFVESPDMMNVYNGNVMLDGNGEATVTMPDWFEALNKEFRYQLTAIGKPSPGLYIAQEISGNRFRIAGGAPGGKVSWMITGIRHDRYADAHRIPVEERKQGSEAGTYLFPEGYGQQSRTMKAERGSVDPPPAKQ